MNITERVRVYFQTKAKQIATLADLSVCEHTGLIGSHREELQRIYLREILPKRYEVGRGMVYGLTGHSREADIVIWDAFDFPILPLADHAFFFVESVRCIIECKSNYSKDELDDMVAKCGAAMSVFSFPSFGIRETIDSISEELISIRQGVERDGTLIVPHRLATAGIFLRGGHNIDFDTVELYCDDIHEKWPDLLLFLEPGIVIIKDYRPTGGLGGHGSLHFYKPQIDALLLFTHELLNQITERSESMHSPLQILQYIKSNLDLQYLGEFEFPLAFPIAQRTPYWRSMPPDEN
jgi:hypothetical protein